MKVRKVEASIFNRIVFTEHPCERSDFLQYVLRRQAAEMSSRVNGALWHCWSRLKDPLIYYFDILGERFATRQARA